MSLDTHDFAEAPAPASFSGLRVAIVHEWLDQWAGSEQTFRELAIVFPDADLYALTARPDLRRVADREVRTTVLDTPLFRERRAMALPLMPLAWRYASRAEYDLVISSTHAFARSFGPGRDALHLTYCHSPMRYAWFPDIDPRGSRAPAVARSLVRRWDLSSVRWADAWAANSETTAQRIRRVYGVESTVIPPPVHLDGFTLDDDDEGTASGDAPLDPASPAGPRPDRTSIVEARRDGSPLVAPAPEGYVISVGRFVEYKRHDLSIAAAAAAGVPIVIAGRGPLERELRVLAADLGARATFVVDPTTAELRALVAGARALVFPGFEDFGIVPIEAMAVGTPVVAFGRGGAGETVRHGHTGLHVPVQEVAPFAAAVTECLDRSWSTDDLEATADNYSVDAFRRRIRTWVLSSIAARTG
jgi:glycosyltransferase involved in cell wall biosynthesis